MAKIPALAYLVIGSSIVYLSRYWENKGMNLEFFYWIGILFLIIGVFKSILWFITKKSKKPKIQERPALEPFQVKEKKIKQTPQYNPEDYSKYCPKCGLLYSEHSNFCSRCGSQLFIKP